MVFNFRMGTCSSDLEETDLIILRPKIVLDLKIGLVRLSWEDEVGLGLDVVIIWNPFISIKVHTGSENGSIHFRTVSSR